MLTAASARDLAVYVDPEASIFLLSPTSKKETLTSNDYPSHPFYLYKLFVVIPENTINSTQSSKNPDENESIKTVHTSMNSALGN